MFHWSSERKWSQQKYTLPSTGINNLLVPKPCVVIGFMLQSLCREDGSDPIPKDLDEYIRPDKSDNCFPFIFFEAASDAQKAHTANLRIASQALYNIYQCMERADKVHFFENVRIFSIALDANDLYVRVHRGKRLSGRLEFRFDTVSDISKYTRDNTCLLVRRILAEYAAKELYPILKSTFQKITD